MIHVFNRCLLRLGVLAASLHVLPSMAGDKEFLMARDAFQQGNAVKLAEAASKLNGDSLKIYADYYQAVRMVDKPDGKPVVSGFLDRYPGTWLSEKLRSEYLRALGRQKDWAGFRQLFPGLESPDPELQCDDLLSRVTTPEGKPDPNVLVQARENFWLNGKDLPAPCNDLMQTALDNKLLGQDDLWARLRLALQAGNNPLARSLAGKLGVDLSPELLTKVSGAPKRYLTTPDVETAIGHELYLAALGRLARQDIDEALALWAVVETRFGDADRAYGWRLLALAGSVKQDVRAVDWFGKSAKAYFPDSDREWQIRIAIRAQRWNDVLEAINGLRLEKQQDRVWRYWRAHAMQKLGDKPKVVEAIWNWLAVDDDFYGLLARDHLGSKLTTRPQIYQPGEADLQRFAADEGLQRAMRLNALDMRAEAVREWGWALRKADDRLLLAAADQAAKAAWYDRAIWAAERTRQLHSYSLRYLTPYKEVAQGYAQDVGLDPAWVYGLIRQESRFVTNARSGVGAGGLMQLMPSTAQWVANRLKIPYHAGMVNDVGMNIRLGTYYLNNSLKNLGDQPVLATAGYNAGPNRARQWQDPDKPLDADIYVETIPFAETRDYVKKVMTNAVHYAIGFGQGPQSINARMGVIPARAAKPVEGP